MEQKTIVNSWNEWDQLKHVIVGVAENSNIPPMEPALEPKLSKDMGMIGSHGPRPKEAVEKAKFQLDNFVKILESLGVKVDRPTAIDFSKTHEYIKSINVKSTDTLIGNRQIFIASMGEGKTVVEKQRKSKAVEEIKSISNQILLELN